jgi:hypothetical protein
MSTLRASTLASWGLTPPDTRAPLRLTILDESVLGVGLREHGLDAAALAALRLDGVDVDAGLVEALLASGLRGKGGKASAGWSLDDVAAVLGVAAGDLVRVDPKCATYRAGEAWARGDAGAVDPGPWTWLDALRAHARAGTLGRLRVAHGRLWVAVARDVPQPRAGEVFLYLDATASLHVARALWPAAQLVEVYGAPLHRPTVLRLDVEGGVERGGTREGRAATPAGRAAALAGRLVAQGEGVGWAPRRDLQDVEHPLHVDGHDPAAWEHHGSSRSRGSNEWAARRRAVVLPYHVPAHSIEALALALSRLDPGPQDVERVLVDPQGQVRREVVQAGGLDAEDWRREALAQLVDAQLYQEAHRVRGLREPGREIVLVGARLPSWLRREAGALVDVEAWAVWAVQGGGVALVDGWREAVIGAAVAAHGGVWAPSVHAWTVGEAREALRATLPPTLRDLPPLPCALDGRDLGDVVGRDWARRFDLGDELVVREVVGPQGRACVVCAHAHALAPAHALQARLWPAWAALRLDVGARLREHVDGLRASGREVTWAALVEASRVARSTWRGWLAAAGLPPGLQAALDAVGDGLGEGGGVLASAPRLSRSPCEHPATPPAPAEERVSAPPTPRQAPPRLDNGRGGLASGQAPARPKVPCPEATRREPLRHLRHVLRVSDVWKLADALDPASPAAQRLRVLRCMPGPWAVQDVVRAVGLCEVWRVCVLQAGDTYARAYRPPPTRSMPTVSGA